MKMIQHVKAVH